MTTKKTPPAPGENPHKPGTKAHTAWAERKAKRDEKAAKLAERGRVIADAMAAGRELSHKPPAALGDWGVTRTRAWLCAAGIARKIAKPETITGPMALINMQYACDAIRRVTTGEMSDSGCADYVSENTKRKAAKD